MSERESQLHTLNAEASELDEQSRDLRDQRVNVQKKISVITSKVSAMAKVANMGDEERSILMQELQAQGIESEETVGTPGV